MAVDSLSALSLQISKRLKDGNSKFELELHPADLGRVDVALNIARDGKVIRPPQLRFTGHSHRLPCPRKRTAPATGPSRP
ncbi:MAG: hypothetical protein WDN06_08420 [Asticcacaulis sp.]